MNQIATAAPAPTSAGTIPEALQTWIADFCASRTSVRVGHMMFATNENVGNIKLEEALYLIRTHKPLANFRGKDPVLRREVAAFVAATIATMVLESFETAAYPGD